MKTIKLSEITIDRIELMKIWDGHDLINRNIDNIINDFNFMNQNVVYEFEELSDELMSNLAIEKVKSINAHICGVLCATSPDSQFNKNHVMCEDEKKAKEIEKTNDFAKSLQL